MSAPASENSPGQSVDIGHSSPFSGQPPIGGCKERNCFVSYLKIGKWMDDVISFSGKATALNNSGQRVARSERRISSMDRTSNTDRYILREMFVVRGHLYENTDCGAHCYCHIPHDAELRRLPSRELEIPIWGTAEDFYRVDLPTKDPNDVDRAIRTFKEKGFLDKTSGRHIQPDEIGDLTSITSYCSPFACYILIPYRYILEGTVKAKFEVYTHFGECRPFPAEFVSLFGPDERMPFAYQEI